MQTLRFIIAAAFTGAVAYGTSAVYSPEHGTRFNLIAAHQEDEGIPPILNATLQEDKDTPQHPVLFIRRTTELPAT